MKKCVNRSKSRNKLLWIILFLGFVCSFSIANAQQQTVSGKITDNKGEGLIGVTVVITGTTTGVVTDYNGEFSISAPVGSELTISFLGYKTQTVVVGTETRIDIKLKAEDVQLEGVTVTALGVKRANRDIGYSVQVVGGEDLMKSQSPNALSSLVGKAAGLTVANSAEMLGSPDLIIRGASDVLIVVDGVPVNSDGFNLNPNDIESYTILKGPNAAALYGFRGQNGAVLITTKKGSDEKVKVEFNSSTSVDAGFISISEVQSDYGIGSNYQYAFGDGPMDQGGKYTRSNVWGPRFEGQDVPQWNSPIDPETGKRTGTPFNSYPDNYEDFLKTGYQTANNLSVATNYDRFHSRISLGHNHTDYMIPNTKLDMYNANIYTGFKVTNKLNIEGNLNYSKQYSNNVPEVWYGPNSYTYMFGVYGTRHYNIEDMEDYWMLGMEGVQQRSYEYGRANNPYFMAYEWTRKHDKTDVHGYVKMDYDLTTDLNVSLRSQVTSWDWFRDERVPYSANKYGREQEKAGDYEEDKRKMFENNTDLLMTYNKTFASDFRLSALAGGNIRTFKYNSSWACADYLVVPGIYNFSNSLNPPRVYNYESEMAVHSGYASLDVAFKKYATLSATGRIDKLSTLPEGNNTFFYPSITLASMMTDYIDMPDFISTVKPRASYANVKGGLTNSSIGPAFVALGYVHPLRPSAGWFTTQILPKTVHLMPIRMFTIQEYYMSLNQQLHYLQQWQIHLCNHIR